MSSFKEQLIKINACQEAIEWAADRTLDIAWAECERGDWMLWLATAINIDQKLVVLAACDCAEPVLQFVEDGETRPAIAIKTAREWCENKATIEQVKMAAYAASSAYVAYAVSAAAYLAADADYVAADATCDAAYLAADAAYLAADAADRNKSLKQSAGFVRARISIELIKKALEYHND